MLSHLDNFPVSLLIKTNHQNKKHAEFSRGISNVFVDEKVSKYTGALVL